MPLFNNFFPAHVIAYTSDRTLDFSLNEDQGTLTNAQKEFLLTQMGFQLPEPVALRQVHGGRIVLADNGLAQNEPVLEEADGLLTKTAQLPLAIRSADCLPVFLYDKKQGGIGLIHVGWKSCRNNILEQAIELMIKNWQSHPNDIQAAFGPAIRSCCYEVGREFEEYFPDEIDIRQGRYYLDLPKVAQNRLIQLGIRQKQITDCGICTCCDSNYFSNRRDGSKTGRMISLMALKTNQGA